MSPIVIAQCPFCDSTDGDAGEPFLCRTVTWGWKVACPCGASGPTMDTKEQAAALWNGPMRSGETFTITVEDSP